MTTRKLQKVQRLSDTARYPRTFSSRLADIPLTLLERLTARDIAVVIDGPMQASYLAGQAS